MVPKNAVELGVNAIAKKNLQESTEPSRNEFPH